jgi:hypothetical protein
LTGLKTKYSLNSRKVFRLFIELNRFFDKSIDVNNGRNSS